MENLILETRVAAGKTEEKVSSEAPYVVWKVRMGTPSEKRLRWPEAFAARVTDAKAMILAGATAQEVMERHGGVVLREAREEISGVYALADDQEP